MMTLDRDHGLLNMRKMMRTMNVGTGTGRQSKLQSRLTGIPLDGTHQARHHRQLPVRLHILPPGHEAGRTISEPKPRPRAEGTGWQHFNLFAFVWVGDLERMYIDVHIQ